MKYSILSLVISAALTASTVCHAGSLYDQIFRYKPPIIAPISVPVKPVNQPTTKGTCVTYCEDLGTGFPFCYRDPQDPNCARFN